MGIRFQLESVGKDTSRPTTKLARIIVNPVIIINDKICVSQDLTESEFENHVDVLIADLAKIKTKSKSFFRSK